jgi:transposase
VSEQDSLLALAGWFAYGMDGACSLPAGAWHDGHRAAAARELSGRSRKVVETIIQTFRDTGSLYTTYTAERGYASDAYVSDEHITEDMKAAIVEYVADARDAHEPTYVTRMAIQLFLLDNFCVRASLKRVGRVLTTLGIQYKKVRGAHNRTSNPIYKLWAQTYVLQIHHALKEGHELVFLDESYAHENAAVDRTVGMTRLGCAGSTPRAAQRRLRSRGSSRSSASSSTSRACTRRPPAPKCVA